MRLVNFGEVLEIKNGRNQKRVENPSGRYPIYGSGGIMGYADEYLCDAETIVLGRKGSINTPIFVEQPFWNVDTAFGLCANKDYLYPKYLYYFCQQFDFERLNTTVTIPSLTKTNLLEVKLPLPPLAEQRRIVGILDKADAIRRKRQQSLKLTDDFLKSVFLDMFGDPVTNPKGWDTVDLNALGEIITGSTPFRLNSDNYGNDIEWIKSDNINTPYHFLTLAKEGLSETSMESARVAPSGAVLVTCIAGSKDCIGNAAIANRKVSFNQQINAIVPKHTWLTNFLYGQIFAQKKIIQQASTESMKGMVSKGRMEKIKFIQPPKNEIEKFSALCDVVFKNCEKMWLAHSYAENTFKSLQQSFFG